MNTGMNVDGPGNLLRGTACILAMHIPRCEAGQQAVDFL